MGEQPQVGQIARQGGVEGVSVGFNATNALRAISSHCCHCGIKTSLYSRCVLVEADEGGPRLVGVGGGGHEGGKGGDKGSEVDFEVHPALRRHPPACTLLS